MPHRGLWASAVVLALLQAGAVWAAPGKPAARAAARPAVAAASARKPVDVAKAARAHEETGNYAEALAELKTLRGMQGPDADLQLFIALDEARTGQTDSAWVHLHGPLMDAALADTGGIARRTEYPFQREGMLINGRFDGWSWYVARARAELALTRGQWSEALRMASRAASARPLSGKDALLLAVAAGRAGDAPLGEAAASWAAYLEPWLPEAHHLRGVWAWRNGRRAEAREAFRLAADLDSSWREPVLALARLRIPGASADSLPRRVLNGARASALVTSAKRPKQEEFVQFDSAPMLLFNPQPQPPDSLRQRMGLKKRTQLYVQVLVSEKGEPLVMDLPYVTEAVMPAGVVNHVLSELGRWRFIPAKKFGKPQRAWASVEYWLEP